MIKSITVGRYLIASGGTSMHIPKSYSASNGKMGDTLFDFDTQQFKVFDGSTWQTMYSYTPMIQLDGEAESLLNWARTKKQEETHLADLAKNNPVVKDLVDQIKQKEEQLRMVQILLKPETTPMGY